MNPLRSILALTPILALLPVTAAAQRPQSPFVRATPALLMARPGPSSGPARSGGPDAVAALAGLPPAGAALEGTFGQGTPRYRGYPVGAYRHSGTAGERLHVRVESGVAQALCVVEAEGWAAVQEAVAAPGRPAAALRGGCARTADGQTAEFSTVLPADGDVVVVVLSGDARAVGPYRLETVAAGDRVAFVETGQALGGILGDGAVDPLEAAASATAGRPIAAHFVEGRAGDRLVVSVASNAFRAYAEVGTGLAEGYAPLVGADADSVGALRLQLVLPRDGVYTVLLGSTVRADVGPYTVDVERASARPWAEVYPGGGDSAGRYAVLVGVGDYPGLGPRAAQDDLYGPRTDVETMRNLLVDSYGFDPAHVVVLEDAEATREGVVEAVRRHLGQAGPDGTAVLYYSGHGMQVPTKALNAEPDGQDESLVLWGRGGEVATLLDYEVGALADGLRAGHTVFILDNCFSGTGTRGASGDFAVRRLDYDDVAGYVAAAADSVAARPALADRVAEPKRHVLLAASRSDQPSLELDGLGGLPGRRGVFTHFLVEALREAAPDATFESVVASIRPRVMGATREVMAQAVGGPPQQPQVEGAQRSSRIAAALGPRL